MEKLDRSQMNSAGKSENSGIKTSHRANQGERYSTGWFGRLVAFLLVFSSLGINRSAALDAGNADTIFNAYNNAFYVSYGNGNAYYKESTDGGRAWFWGQANMIEMVVDTYERTGSPGQRDMISALCNGFLDYHGQDWSWNEYNDDVMWACIVFTKAYRVTGNRNFLNRAVANFNMAWTRGWSSDLGGGMWWRTDNQSKNACDNCPAAIVGCLLYDLTGNSVYLTRAKLAVDWVKSHLVADSGAVYDNMSRSGVVTNWTFSYNSGTYIGACNYLYKFTGDATYLSEALKATRYFKNSISDGNGILPDYGGGDGSGFNGVGIRWVTRFVKDQNLWQEFYPWLSANANKAWSVRRGDNLSWNNWKAATATGTRQGFECFGSVTALQIVPFSNPALSGVEDSDGDGFSNLFEYAFGMDPNVADSQARFTPQVEMMDATVHVTYQRPAARTDVSFLLESSTDLVNWTPVSDWTTGTADGLESREFTEAGSAGTFYRVEVKLP